MEKILIQFNEAEAAKEISKLHTVKDQLQEVATAFTGLEQQLKEIAPAFVLKDGFNLTVEELQTLYQGARFSSLVPNEKAIEQLILHKLFPDGTHGGLPVRFDRISEYVVMPSPHELIAAIKRTDSAALSYIQANNFQVKKNKVIITPGTEDSIKESFKVYAENEKELERLNRAKALAEAVTEIEQNLEPGEFLNDLGDFERVIESDGEKYVPSGSYVKYGAVGQYTSQLDIFQRSKTIRESKLQKSAIGTPIQTGDWSGFDTGTLDPIPSPGGQSDDDFIAAMQDMNK